MKKDAQILVVEDESIVAKNIQNRLESMGYTVPAIASTGKEAMQIALETMPDLLLMDINLKGEIDGIETARRINDQLDIPVVYLTAYADENTISRAKNTEPFGYLTKPFDARELRATIEMAIYKHMMVRELKSREHLLTCLLENVSRECSQWND
ncbi:MAG: response regulator [candidate division Zixibacteria bacterium]|nr:response regulator [candidate division Zixibacteria bacterium]